MKKILNVGGNSKDIPLPPEYAGWQHVLLDIDPRGNPDVVCDARALTTLPAATYDCVYCSHNLEHYFHHDVPKVLRGFAHVLKSDGFVQIRVPDMESLIQFVAEQKLDIEDVLYESPMGPVRVRDVIYGMATEIETSGNDFFAHKTGFTEKSLTAILIKCGFPYVFTLTGNSEISALAFTHPPAEYAKQLFGLP